MSKDGVEDEDTGLLTDLAPYLAAHELLPESLAERLALRAARDPQGAWSRLEGQLAVFDHDATRDTLNAMLRQCVVA